MLVLSNILYSFDSMFSMSRALGWGLGKRERSDMDPAPQELIDMDELSLLHEKELQGREWSKPQEERWQNSLFPQLQYPFLKPHFSYLPHWA